MLLTFLANNSMWMRQSLADKTARVSNVHRFWPVFKTRDRKGLYASMCEMYSRAASTEFEIQDSQGTNEFAVPLLPDMPVWGAGTPIPDRGHNFFSKGVGRIAIPHGGNAILRDLLTPHIFEAEQVALVNLAGEVVAYFVGNDISAGKGFDPDSKARKGMFVAGHTILLCENDDNLPGDTVIALSINGTPGVSCSKTVTQYSRDPRILVPELYRILGGKDGPSTGFALSLGAAAKNNPDSDHTPKSGNIVEISITGLPTLRHGVEFAG